MENYSSLWEGFNQPTADPHSDSFFLPGFPGILPYWEHNSNPTDVSCAINSGIDDKNDDWHDIITYIIIKMLITRVI